MHLSWIALAGFRSHQDLEWRPDPGTNLVIGKNGAGKTNLLEGIGYLASLKSFRGSPDAALVHHEAKVAIARGEVASSESTTLIEVEIRRQGGRRALVNRGRLARTADLLGHVRIVGFLPDDLEIVKGGPAIRRDTLDDLAIQLWPSSYVDLGEFERSLRQRNAFLKSGSRDLSTLAVWDERLAVAGARLMSRRARAAEFLQLALGKWYREIAGSEDVLLVDYVSAWRGELCSSVGAGEFTDRLREALLASRGPDLDRRLTLVGPHRDEPSLRLNGHDLRHHGSQGEQRTAALAIRLASHSAIESLTNEPPILLLDDVFSELDPQRSAALAAILPAHGQAVISTADRADVPLDGKVWEMEGGKLR